MKEKTIKIYHYKINGRMMQIFAHDKKEAQTLIDYAVTIGYFNCFIPVYIKTSNKKELIKRMIESKSLDGSSKGLLDAQYKVLNLWRDSGKKSYY